MTDIMKSLDAAFNLLASIPVKGQDVDAMATARQHLRRAYSGLERLSQQAAAAKPEEGGANE